MKAAWAAAGGVAAVGLSLGAIGLVIARKLTNPVRARVYELTIRAVDRSGGQAIIVLDRDLRTEAHGDYCLLLEDGSMVKLSSVVEDRGPRLVGREVVGMLSAGVGTGTHASWSGVYFSSPQDAGLELTEVEIVTDVGPAPAWLILGEDRASGTWAIHIHGLGSPRAGTLRGVQVAVEAGLTSLVVSYRNDGEGPMVGTGRSELGAAEVSDVRAAIRFALQNGAHRVVLFGWSMGAAIALQLADEAECGMPVAGLVLESPVLDWAATVATNCARAGLPAWSGRLALPWLGFPLLSRAIGLQHAIRLPAYNWISRAAQLAVPTLILHGRGDTSSPFELSASLRGLRPDMVELEIFDADHTMSWNIDCERWRAAVTFWLEKQLPANRE